MISLYTRLLGASTKPPTASAQDANTPPAAEELGSRQAASIWITSVLVHMLLLSMMGLFVRVAPAVEKMVLVLPMANQKATAEEELVELIDFEIPEFEVDPIEEVVQVEDLFPEIDIDTIELELPREADALTALVKPMNAMSVASSTEELIRLPETMGGEHSGSNDASGTTGDPGGNANVGSGLELGGRASRRIKFATPEMEYAIDKGLIWLARHQLSDGGWSFEHRVGECRGRCPDPGSKRGARVAATGLALLPFLGAGHSPANGEYRQTVSAGINYLISNTARNGSLWQAEGRMYGHGIATLALCECYGILAQAPPSDAVNANPMVPHAAYESLSNQHKKLFRQWGTVDVEQLRYAATAAANFIVSAQATDGGWRYRPGELGDTSVVGWQIMALKSARDAGLGTNEPTFAAASKFLDLVQLDPVGDQSSGVIGTRYAYKPAKRKVSPATTAIGLACRIYMGTSPFHPGMEIAVKRIVTAGPLDGNMYYNCYANQVMFQHGGAEWEWWSGRLNQALMNSQNRRGHLEGSWHFGHADKGGGAGGRLYATSMSCLCLEETFRHLPVLRANAQLRFVDGLRAAEQDLPEGQDAEAEEPADADFPDFD